MAGERFSKRNVFLRIPIMPFWTGRLGSLVMLAVWARKAFLCVNTVMREVIEARRAKNLLFRWRRFGLAEFCGRHALIAVAVLLSLGCNVVFAEVAAVETGNKLLRVSGLTLDALIERAIERHPQVMSSRATLEGAEAEVAEAKWQFYPSPTVGVEQDTGGTDVVVALEQPLWTGGRLSSDLRGATARAGAQEKGIELSQLDIALKVVESYQLWKQSVARIRVVQRRISRLSEYDHMIRHRVDAGVSAQGDQDLVSTRVRQAQSDLQAIEAQERSALAHLSELEGVSLGSVDVSEEIEGRPVESCAVLIERAFALHPGLQRLKYETAAARAEVDSSAASAWPNLVARAEYRHGDLSSTNDRDDFRALVALRYVPGAGLSTLSRVRAQKARVRAGEEAMNAARRDISAQLQSECENFQAVVRRKEVLQQSLEASRGVLDSYTRLFVAGKRSWLDVINAARELAAIETSLADIEAQFVGATYRLEILTGNLERFGVGHE
ncbi:TolC family protein [Emcibacter nanhaiensis]|uniref:TolC family protein n=1 Tax=Emcibacter nanhaiensis TaxID=1505037 RepID=UPI0015E2D705|nr:TolC family protein [Emcibacter nanhaiensis]